MQNSDQHLEPRLAVELEQEIFETAAIRRPIGKIGGLINLMLVARRVHDWVKPFLYSVMIKTNRHEVNYPPYHSRQGPQYGEYIVHLMIQVTYVEEVTEILESCPNVRNLAINGIEDGPYNNEKTSRILRSRPILRLSVDIRGLFFITPKSKPLDSTIFPHLTHLEISETQTMPDIWEPLTGIPTITHLAIASYDTDLIERILKQPRRLELLIIFVNPPSQDLGKEIYEGQAYSPDGRVVLLNEINDRRGEWERGAYGQQDFWIVGERRKAEKLPLHTQLALLR